MTLPPKDLASLLMGPGLKAMGLVVRLCQSPGELTQYQKLRYQVFHGEWGAQRPPGAEPNTDADSYDALCDHLLVCDQATQMVVAGARLARQSTRLAAGEFLIESEYNISGLLAQGWCLGELSRTCVHKAYRTRGAMGMLWRGLAVYSKVFGLDALFGTVSFPGTDAQAIAHELNYLYQHHLAPESYRPSALQPDGIGLPIDGPCATDGGPPVKLGLPPLVKGYVRVGGVFSDSAFFDRAWKCIDMAVIVRTGALTQRYARNL
jgi:L-ornithine Nalpha-acyltransferase